MVDQHAAAMKPPALPTTPAPAACAASSWPAHVFQAGVDAPPVEWLVSDGLVAYDDAVAFMEDRVARIAAGEARELAWLVEHPPLYTAGTSAKAKDLVAPGRFPVFETGRGGQFTYHGPGQRVVYVMLDLKRRRPDVRAFVCALEDWLIGTLASFNITGERREGRVGVWVRRPEKAPLADGTMREDKVAAIGIRVRRWVSFHGVSLNVEPELEHFSGIVPCGVQGHGVASLVELGIPVTMPEVDHVLRQRFESVFGPTTRA
ncbi:octanoyltransferase [Camelimonas fluminis]|uniref:Octanoyltransferase n=1 Tax=Camelimonas fluminis TaxID=1576911 RepID=A0ABV7UF88_9HYPH|nr:lipoyl(octanoyl) transferase LipB [Camelimonas fluminis]GHE66844.1 octanoyltransferase [Camelimonas fluminis]